MSAEAMSRCSRICLNDGLFLGLELLWRTERDCWSETLLEHLNRDLAINTMTHY